MKKHCAKCGKETLAYNRFKFTFAEKEYKFNGTQNIDQFILCHKHTDELSNWLEASKENFHLVFE